MPFQPKRQTSKEALAQSLRVTKSRTGIDLSSHRENGQHLIETGAEPHTGRTMFRGTAKECLAFLDGFVAHHEYKAE